MSGLSLVGCARCIAMVIVWVELAKGDREYCAAIVALNSLITIFLYSPYALLFLVTLPQAMLGTSETSTVDVTMADIAISVGIYLGIPLVAGVLCWYVLCVCACTCVCPSQSCSLIPMRHVSFPSYSSSLHDPSSHTDFHFPPVLPPSRVILTKAKGKGWYYSSFAPRIGPLTLAALLFTIVVLFATQSQSIISQVSTPSLQPILLLPMFCFCSIFLLTCFALFPLLL